MANRTISPLGARLRRLRELRAWTQAQAGDRLDVTLWQAIHLQALARLYRGQGCTLRELLDLRDQDRDRGQSEEEAAL